MLKQLQAVYKDAECIEKSSTLILKEDQIFEAVKLA